MPPPTRPALKHPHKSGRRDQGVKSPSSGPGAKLVLREPLTSVGSLACEGACGVTPGAGPGGASSPRLSQGGAEPGQPPPEPGSPRGGTRGGDVARPRPREPPWETRTPSSSLSKSRDGNEAAARILRTRGDCRRSWAGRPDARGALRGADPAPDAGPARRPPGPARRARPASVRARGQPRLDYAAITAGAAQLHQHLMPF